MLNSAIRTVVLTAAVTVGTLSGAVAQPGQGPVATACAADMEKVCAGKAHVRREMRNCLEANKDKVSPACKAALETTGPGRGAGMGMGKQAQ